MKKKEIIVIGGGASGMMAAIAASSKDSEVLLLEQTATRDKNAIGEGIQNLLGKFFDNFLMRIPLLFFPS